MCANNLRQIGIAWYLYLDDNDETFPASVESHMFGGKAGQKWYRVETAETRILNKYLDVFSEEDKNGLEVFHCPSDSKPTMRIGYTEFDYCGNSYQYNESLNSNKLSSIQVPLTRLWLADDYSFYHGNSIDNTKKNVLFVDGHVKMYNYTDDYDIGNDDPSKEVYIRPSR